LFIGDIHLVCKKLKNRLPKDKHQTDYLILKSFSYF
jgi:hypothetical protein